MDKDKLIGEAPEVVFADVHNHSLFGVDDGAANEEKMWEMITHSYNEGVRYLCLTPHYHPGYYGDNIASSQQAFDVLCRRCAESYPDLKLLLANELHYSEGCLSWIKDKQCRTMRGSRLVLVDFRENAEEAFIVKSLNRMTAAGYVPILAHAERYMKLSVGALKMLKQDGILVQINAGSCFGSFGARARHLAKKILALRLADFVGSDGHNMNDRSPEMRRCYELIAKKYSREYADFVCRDNAVSLFFE